MSYSPQTDRYNWKEQSLGQLEQELEQLLQEGFGIPSEPGGWWHEYVCPEHHIELEFDPFEDDAHTFRCPYGCELEGEPYRGGWLVFKHQQLARYALQAAAVYEATGKAQFAELGVRIIGQYARQFPHYPVHPGAQAWMLKGRAFHQALSEAIWATTLIRAYLLLRDEQADFGEWTDPIDTFLCMLEASMTQYRHILIHERNNAENNYTAWLNAALACVYAAWRDPVKLQGLIDGEGGFHHHLSIGVKADQLEFEGSTYYHVFVLRAYMITAEMAHRFGIDLYETRGEQGQSLEGMFDVLAELANDQGELPALHDGPYKRIPYAREIAEIMEAGLSRYEKEAYVPILAEAYRQMNGSPIRHGLEAVVFGHGNWDLNERPRDRKSQLLKQSGFAVIRQEENPLSLLVDFGPHGGSHGHYDKLHITIEHLSGTVAPELGMVPYGSALRKKWYAATSSHNTISVGGRSQAEHTGQCMKFECTESYSYVWVRSDEAYDRCVMNRHLFLCNDWLLDWFEVECEEEQQIDWWLHPLGASSDSSHGEWIPFPGELGDEDGYQLLQDISMLNLFNNGEEQTYPLLFPINGNKSLGSVSCVGTIFPGLSSSIYQYSYPGTADDPSKRLYGLLHRQQGKRGSFVHVYKDGDVPVSLQLLNASGDGSGEPSLIIGGGPGQNRSWTVTLKPDSSLKVIEGEKTS